MMKRVKNSDYSKQNLELFGEKDGFNFSILKDPAQEGFFHPALDIYKKFDDIKTRNDILPYKMNLQAFYLLEYECNEYHKKLVKNYILWYVEKLNNKDRLGLRGTIYDYEIIDSGEEKPIYFYETINGNAATFLLLAASYYKITKDANLILDITDKLKDIASLIMLLQDNDGLIRAMPVPYPNVKYLTDNAESYKGLNAYLKLSKEFGWQKEKLYEEAIEKIKKGISSRFYNPKKRTFDWAYNSFNRYPVDQKVYYPDSISQVNLIAFCSEACNFMTQMQIWSSFVVHHKDIVNKLPSEQKIIYKIAVESFLKTIQKMSYN